MLAGDGVRDLPGKSGADGAWAALADFATEGGMAATFGDAGGAIWGSGGGGGGGGLSTFSSRAMTETSSASFQPGIPSFQTCTVLPGLAAIALCAASARENGPLRTPPMARYHSTRPPRGSGPGPGARGGGGGGPGTAGLGTLAGAALGALDGLDGMVLGALDGAGLGILDGTDLGPLDTAVFAASKCSAKALLSMAASPPQPAERSP